MCRYKNYCKFDKTNNCAFKYEEIKTDDVSNDLEKKLNLLAKEIKSLNTEIINFKIDVSNKEKKT